LTEAVRKSPFSLILLDEIEKANPKVWDLFLQILDEGYVTDGMGRRVSFVDTIIIMTSNVLSNEIADLMSMHKSYPEVYREIYPNLRKFFKVEFLNRFDKVVMFKPLGNHELLQIAEIMLQEQKKNLENKGIELGWSRKLLEEIINLGYDKLYGAREMRRVITEFIEDKLADLIIKGKLKPGDMVEIKSIKEFLVR
jgi:ATP-dependent Clp protease ATP-binding subunit ClpB